MTVEEVEMIVAELRTVWPMIKIDLPWITRFATETTTFTYEQVKAGIHDLFVEGREYPPNMSQIVHAVRWRARAEEKQKVDVPALPAPNGLARYLERIGASSFAEAVEIEGRARGWDDEKAQRWRKGATYVRPMPGE